jgi:carboxyl-terminal processing protease
MKPKLLFLVMVSMQMMGCNRHAQVQFAGIGIQFAAENGGVTILHVLTNTPAFRAGLYPGLIVQKIDGTSTEGMQQSDWHYKMQGPVGMKITLEIVDAKKGETNTVELTKENIVLTPSTSGLTQN